LNFPSSKQAEHEKKNAWRQYVFTFGKYKGKTLEYVRVKDLDYIKNLYKQGNDPNRVADLLTGKELTVNGLLLAVNKCWDCLEYLQKTDPYYTPGFSVKSNYLTKGVVLEN